MTTTNSIRIEFGGGLEVLFSRQKSYKVDIPSTKDDGKPTDLKYLIHWLKENLLKEREELFLEGDTVYAFVHLFRVSIRRTEHTFQSTGYSRLDQ